MFRRTSGDGIFIQIDIVELEIIRAITKMLGIECFDELSVMEFLFKCINNAFLMICED